MATREARRGTLREESNLGLLCPEMSQTSRNVPKSRTYILLGSWPLAAKVSGESPLTALEGRKVVGDSRTEF